MPNPIDQITPRKILELGLKEGMTVLDFGCGAGVTTLMLANLLGPTGKVVGFDINETALEVARKETAEQGIENITFQSGDLKQFIASNPGFDIVFGRRVLMYIGDVVGTLGTLKKAMKSNGAIIFQEHDGNLESPMDELPLHDKIRRLSWETIKREGGNHSIGQSLWSDFNRAGLNVSHLEGVANLLHPGSSSSFYAETMQFMRARMLQQQLIEENEFNPETLGDDLAQERSASDKTYSSEVVYWIVAE